MLITLKLWAYNLLYWLTFFVQVTNSTEEALKGGCIGFSRLVLEPEALIIDGDPPQALRSVLILDGPAVLQENFKQLKIDYSISEINEMLVTYKEKFFQVSIRYKLICQCQCVV